MSNGVRMLTNRCAVKNNVNQNFSCTLYQMEWLMDICRCTVINNLMQALKKFYEGQLLLCVLDMQFDDWVLRGGEGIECSVCYGVMSICIFTFLNDIISFCGFSCRGLEVLQQIQNSVTRQNALSQIALSKLYNAQLSAKYAFIGRLGKSTVCLIQCIKSCICTWDTRTLQTVSHLKCSKL